MQAAIQFTAETRANKGKGSARAARRAGMVPVVTYASNKRMCACSARRVTR